VKRRPGQRYELTDATESFFEIQIPSGKNVVFRTVEELDQWVTEELSFWAWTSEILPENRGELYDVGIAPWQILNVANKFFWKTRSR
jgi:hypothetical protein